MTTAVGGITIDLILKTATALVAEGVPPEELSHTRVAAECGISQSTVRYHFPNGAPDLLEGIFQASRDEREASGSLPLGREAFFEDLARRFAEYEQNRQIVALLAATAGGRRDAALEMRRQRLEVAFAQEFAGLGDLVRLRAVALLYVTQSARGFDLMRKGLIDLGVNEKNVGRETAAAAIWGLQILADALLAPPSVLKLAETAKANPASSPSQAGFGDSAPFVNVFFADGHGRQLRRLTPGSRPEVGWLRGAKNQQTIGSIIVAACAVIAEEGALGFTVNQVAQRVPVSRLTISRHRADLLKYVLEVVPIADGQRKEIQSDGYPLADLLVLSAMSLVTAGFPDEPQRLGLEPLLKMVPDVYRRFGRHERLVNALMCSRAARIVSDGGRHRRMGTVRKIVQDELGADSDARVERYACALVFLYQSVSAAQAAQDVTQGDLEPLDAARGATWAIEAIMEAVRVNTVQPTAVRSSVKPVTWMEPPALSALSGSCAREAATPSGNRRD